MNESAHVRFEHLYRRRYLEIFAYCRRRLGCDAAAADVTAEVFVVAWRHMAQLDQDPRGWLYGVARRTLANHLRGVRRQNALVAKVTMHQARPAHGDSEHGQLLAALATLSAADQELVQLKHWEELPIRHIATALGISSATCRVRLHRAMTRLRQALVTDQKTPSDVVPDTSRSASVCRTSVHD